MPMMRTVFWCCLLLVPSLGLAATSPDENGSAGSADVPAAPKVAVSRDDFDWSPWQRLPVLDDGRIKPLDTLADEIVTLVVARSKWTDPDTGVVYRAPELLYAWITDPEAWVDKPIIRCEFRPLRQILNTDEITIPTEGTYVSLGEILNWKESRTSRGPVYWSKDLGERIEAIDRAHRQKRAPSTVGETAEDRALNVKVAELFRHVQSFLTVRDAENIFVVPALDPRTLTKQTNPDQQLRVWVPLGSLLHPENWRNGDDVTLAAVMAADHSELLRELLSRSFYPESHPNHPSRLARVLPQLAQAQQVKEQLKLEMQQVKADLDKTREAYDAADAGAFASAMQTFVRDVRRLATAMEKARTKMTPPEPNSLDFKEFDRRIWEIYTPLELSDRQMSFSAYPAPGAVDVELVYNTYQPFRSAWIFFLVATVIVVISAMVKTQRSVLLLGLVASLCAIAYSTWGFGLRIAIAGRPPVTNMYETVIWVSYVVAVLGLWFCLLPLIWPGVSWAWRLAGLPLRPQRDSAGSIRGIEFDRVGPEDRDRFAASMLRPIQAGTSIVRLAGFVGIVFFLTRSETSFRIIELAPPLFGKAISIGSLGTWCVGIITVLVFAWYTPRALLALLGAVVTGIPESRRDSGKLWEQTFERRYFM